MISREEALNLLRYYLKDERIVKHCLAVEAIMRALAKKLSEDETIWMLVGLLHDIDYDFVERDMKRHGLEALSILKSIGLPLEALEAIAGHNENNGFKITSEKSKKILHALRASDHVSGLIIATTLVMPSKKLAEVRLETVIRKYKSKDFARGVDRERIREIEILGVKLEEFMVLAIEALKKVASELGL
ncbi:MAG: HDIG domain-containing protein [Ignisphaera sp.]|uniref:HDIG domain-containing protein n=1 Tax=Ignisphaera aggregans TaxID=334771 RepID=A0A7C4JKI6_9CREN